MNTAHFTYKVLFLSAALLSALPACRQSEEYDLSWLDDMIVELPPELDGINTAYRLEITNDIKENTYRYDGEKDLETDYTPATTEQAVAVTDFLEKEIFPLFPEGFIKTYMPATIFIADEVTFHYSYDLEDYDTEEGKYNHIVERRDRALYGDIGEKHLTLAAARLAGDRDSLRFEWTSLLIERMMSNIARWEEPTDFITFTNSLYRQYYEFRRSYYQSALSLGEENFGHYGTPGSIDEFSYWIFSGSIREVRYGHSLYYGYTEAYIDAYSRDHDTDMHGTKLDNYCWYYPTYRQDFADYAAYRLTHTQAQWDDFVQHIDGLTLERTIGGELVVNTCSRETFETKMKEVETYMKRHFDWDIAWKTDTDQLKLQ